MMAGDWNAGQVPGGRTALGEAVKIAFAGKGGSGKTTLSSLFVRHCSAARRPPDLAARTSHLPGCHGCRRTHCLPCFRTYALPQLGFNLTAFTWPWE
jgi:hypothetical protein